MNNISYHIPNLVIFYIIWMWTMIAVSKHNELAGPLVAVGLIAVQLAIMKYGYQRDLKGIFSFVLLFLVAGMAIDSSLMHLGVLTFSANPWHEVVSPPWMIVLWCELGVALYISGNHVFKHYLGLAAAALLGASVFYTSLAEFSAVFWYDDLLDTMLIGIIWSIMFPLCVCIHQRFFSS